MARPNEPLGLPKGSVRSLIVLSLVVSLELVFAALAVRFIFAADTDAVSQAFNAVLLAVLGLAQLAVGFYFGTRNPGGPA